MATRLFLRAATTSDTGLPTAEQHTSFTSDRNGDAQSVNRTLSTTKGASQTSIPITAFDTISTFEYYFTKFVSDPLSMSSISANTWTVNLAAYSQHSAVNFPNSGSGPMQVNVYVWRPGSPGTKVGTIYQGGTTNVTEATTTERVKHATFSGAAVSSMQTGDRIVFELWAQFNSALDWIVRYYFDGTTENTTPDASVSNHASFLETPQTLSFGGGGGGTLVSQTSIHKYDVLTDTPTYVSATSIHKYHVNPREGFTLFARLFVPYANNQTIFGRRSTLFSKIDTDQVDYAYSVQMDDNGNMFWFVRSAGRESWISANGVVDPQIFNLYDFTDLDYKSSDYYTQASLPPLPSPIPFVDVAFTYSFADRRMQIIKNGVLVADTDQTPLPQDMVSRWVLDEGAGIVANNRVPGGNSGTITGATWGTLGVKTYLLFDGAADKYITVNSYSYLDVINEITLSLWYRVAGTPTTGTFDNLFFKNWSSNGSFVCYLDCPSSTPRFVWALKNNAGVTFSVVSSITPTVGVWYNIVVRWKDGFAPTITVNNTKSTGSTAGIGPLSTGTVIFRIGAPGVSTPEGYIRDVTHWNRELSDSEVTTINSAGLVYPLTSALVGHWMLNEGGDTGNTPVLPTDFLRLVHNSVRVFGATDGTITGAGWTSLAGNEHEKYLNFEGTANYVVIPNYPALQEAKEYTISLWYYHRSLPNTDHFLVSTATIGVANTFTLYAQTTGFVQMALWNNAATRFNTTFGSAFPTANTWYHIAAKWTLGSTAKVFVNGVKVTGPTVTGTLNIGSADLRLGHTGAGAPDGMLYDLKIWNRELADNEIAEIYGHGQAASGFPVWHKDPDPPPDVPVPITNPFVEVYNVSTPSALNQELVRLHAVIATGFEEEYDVGLGSSVAAQNPPFATILDQPPTGGGGGGGSPETNYDVSQSSSSHLEFEDSRSRWAILVNSGASVIGKIVTKMTFRGRRYGSSSLGTVTARIWKAGGGTQDIGSTSATGWGDSDADQATFENTGNSYACVQGDRIGFEISWSPSSSNSIECSQIDSTTSGYTTQFYDGGWDNSGHTGVSMGMKVESGSASSGTDVNIVWPPFNEVCFGCPAGANGIRSYGIRIPSGSSLIGKKPTRVTFWLKKVGSPSGNVVCYIQRNGGASSVQFGASLSVSSGIDGTLLPKEFTDTGNGGDAGYALQTNDRIYFLWQSSDSSNYLVTQRLTGTTVGDAIETAYGDSDPAPTSTSTGWFNTSSNDACIKVAEGGFNIAAKDPWYELNNVNTRIGERLKSTGSPLNNKKITRVIVRLKAVMAPTGSIFVKIRDSGNTEREQLGVIDASMVSTTDFTDYTVTNIYQGFVMQDEWGIFLEYTGGTSVNKILVNVKHEGADQTPPDSAANSLVVIYSGAYTEVAADLSGKMFTGGSASDPAARIRVGEKVALDTSGLRLKKISRAELQIKRTGPLVPGSVYLRIRDPEDDSIMATIGELEALSIPLSMGTQTFTKIPVSTVAIPTQGILTVEYNDGDDDNYVEVMVSKVNAFDDTAKTYLVKYDDILGAYETTFTAYDLVGKLEEGGDTFTPSADEIPPPTPPTYDHDLLIFAGGHEYGYDDEPQNWLNAVAPDVRIYWKLLSLNELLNIYINRIDRQPIDYGDVARTGYFSMPEQA